MIADILRRLTAPAPEPLNPEDARRALAALLVRVARTDGDYSPGEIRRIDRILATRYGLGEDAAQSLRAEAETLEASAPDTVRFTRAIKDAVPYEERIGVIESLWQVALADGQRDESEDAILRMASNFLGVSDMDSALARKRVDEGG
ncbi:TerB family tellurite resistance protein [Roseovarius spongiae]|uniref:TerB family tellurite resistance protein n=1 Tax=Roseovarius spongiae TaxID=2320272 RepID=A0A3A8B5J9_9RHOB|nr:TerB family tellurite resistance protein [Roseovarius spongiae]RKF14946.1 TerB family tellurite resistance protein [Roseovarius spongiae]